MGLRPYCQYKINLFRDFLDRNGLMDMEVKGRRFTWHNNLRYEMVVKERIDRVLANWGWRQMFPNVMVTAPPPISSDHSPPFSMIC